MFTFNNMILHTSPRDADVRIEGVLVGNNRTARKVGHMKSFMKDFVFDTLRSFLQGDEMPLSCDSFLDAYAHARAPALRLCVRMSSFFFFFGNARSG